jgi:hypothetical protein
MPQVLPNAAVYGGIGFLQAHQAKYYESPEVRSLQERMTIEPMPDWPSKGDERYSGRVTLTLKDGRTLERESLWRRMNEEELDAYFLYLVSLRVGEAKASSLASVLKGLDKVGNIADVMAQLEFPEAYIDDL